MSQGTILIVYGTTEGQTEKIAEHIAELIEKAGRPVRLARVDHLPADIDLEAYAGVILGGSVHLLRHQRALARFAKQHRDELARMHNAFFSVSLSAAHHTADGRKGAVECVARFVAETGYHPQRVATFAGALLYSHYGFLKRFVLRRISARAGGPTDTTHDYEFTDWSCVSRFTDDFLAALDIADAPAPRRAPEPLPAPAPADLAPSHA